jgi:hypothetical protein
MFLPRKSMKRLFRKEKKRFKLLFMFIPHVPVRLLLIFAEVKRLYRTETIIKMPVKKMPVCHGTSVSKIHADAYGCFIT